MYKQCKTAASSARQKEMADGLLRLMREHNYHDISVADICRSWGSPGTPFTGISLTRTPCSRC